MLLIRYNGLFMFELYMLKTFIKTVRGAVSTKSFVKF